MIRFDPTLLHEYLALNAGRTPEKTALIFGAERWSYRALDGWTDRLSAALQRSGIGRGDRVVIFLDNCPAAVIAIYGTLKAGGVFVMINGTVKAPKLQYILQNSQARMLIADHNKAAVVREAMAGLDAECPVLWVGGKPHPEAAGWEDLFAGYTAQAVPAPDGEWPRPPRVIDIDLAALIYTSGSTGEPKGVMSTHHNMVSAARSIIQYLENRPDDVVLDVLPLSFDYGLYQVLMAFIYGGTVVLEPSFNYLQTILERIARERVTVFPIVPTILALLLKFQELEGYDFSSIRIMTNTGAAVPTEHIARVRRAFPHIRFYSMFGLTECKRVCFLPPEELDRRPGSVGQAMPNCEVRLVDDQGREVAPGEAGELVVRGANVMQGYWRDPELTARVYRPGAAPGERVLHSGDLFRRDEDGFLYFLGRKDDMIKSRGERISPKEVENLLCRIPGVSEAAVLGVPDPIIGQAVKACVVPLPGVELSAREIVKHCTGSMESFMVPRIVEILAELPKTPNGKVDKKKLAAQATEPAAPLLKVKESK